MAKTIAKRAFSSQKSHPPKKQAKSYTMELLLVLDKTVLDYRQDFDVENYALTLLNMVLTLPYFPPNCLSLRVKNRYRALVRLENKIS